MSQIQKDSFFALPKEEQSVKIERIWSQIEPIRCILKQNSDSYEENLEKIIQRRNKKISIDQDIINADSILHTNMFLAFQKADIKLWMPSHLTDTITILFIHQQDGRKRSYSF